MALLAEGKKKAKYGLDPRNTNWSNDDSKFGQRLMEKMGWEKGKGLGANETGMTEHIKASYKWDQRGLGATPQSADAWVAHQDDFNDLLKMLNSDKADEAPVEKDKKTQILDGQKRYYGRFSRGRVQKLRTTEDLDCIFGRRKTASEPTSPVNQSRANSDEDGSDSEQGAGDSKVEKSHGLTTVTSATSVQDYFAKKMSELRARRQGQTTGVTAGGATMDTREDKQGQDATGGAPSAPHTYGMVAFSYGAEGGEGTGGGEGQDSVKDRNEARSSGWYTGWTVDGQKENTEDEEPLEGTKKSKKKKKKKEKIKDMTEVREEVSRSEVETSPAAGGEDDAEVAGDINMAVTKDDVEGDKVSKKKKKKKKEKKECDKAEVDAEPDQADTASSDRAGLSQLATPSSHQVDQPDTQSKEKKKKKKEKKRKADEHEDGTGEETSSKRRKTLDETDEHTCEDHTEGKETNISDEECKPKKKKKSKGKTPDETEVAISLSSGEKSQIGTGEEEEKTRKADVGEEKEKLSGVAASSDITDLRAMAEEGRQTDERRSSRRGKKGGDEKKKRSSKGEKKQGDKKKKRKKSMFVGSNFEDLDGYGDIQFSKYKEKEEKERAKKKKKEIMGIRARDIGEELRLVSKYHTR